MKESQVEVSLRKGKVQSFLDDVVELCIKHNASIESSDAVTTDFDEPNEITFHGWESFSNLRADKEGASLYWSRIQTDIVVRRKHEQRKSKEDC